MSEPLELDRRAGYAAAEEMRLYRSWLRDQVSSGLSIDALMTEQESTGRCTTIKIVVLAEKVPGVGKVRARRAMQSLGIVEDARWGEVAPPTLRALWSAMADAATRPL
ncbi:MAG: hypothetical protein NVSMB16_13940 [Acidimicrobiales bacterium]